MFYIRSNTSRKVLKENVLLEEGLNFVEGSNQNLSLMYKLPNGKGIKVTTSKDSKEYDLMLEGYPTRKSRKVLGSNVILKELYLEIKNIKLESDFNGKVSIREKVNGNELAILTKGHVLESVIRDISIPLNSLEKSNHYGETNEPTVEESTTIQCSQDIETSCDNSEVNNISASTNENNIDEPIKCEPKLVSNSKFRSYNISGTLRSGSSVILSERIYDYKVALEKYNEVKELNSNNFKEICLNGFRDDGTSSVRFKKTYEPDILSYDYISNFIQDLAERLKLLKLLESDAKSAMAIEDKRYNAFYHIMEACDLDFNNPSFRENMINMKISADKRRDMKMTVSLLNSINSILSVPDTLSTTIDNCLSKIEAQSNEGIRLYKNKSVDELVKEYEIDDNTLNLGEMSRSKLTVRPLAIEGKVVVYEKHFK